MTALSVSSLSNTTPNSQRGVLEKARPFFYPFIMKTITPYDDEKMTFHGGRYQLTLQVVKDEFENTFQDDQILKKRIRKNSKKVYDFIFYRGYSGNKDIIEKLINHTDEGRKFIFEVLVSQMEADLESGYNDLSMTSPVNVSNGQVIDREILANNQVSIDTEQLIENSATYFGVSIVYRSPFPWIMRTIK